VADIPVKEGTEALVEPATFIAHALKAGSTPPPPNQISLSAVPSVEAEEGCSNLRSATRPSPKLSKEDQRGISDVVIVADSVKKFVELLTVTEASSYDHDLLVSALVLLHALLEGQGKHSPNCNLQNIFVLQVKAAGLLEFLSDLQEIGDAYVRSRARQVWKIMGKWIVFVQEAA
jgi:hypothetical protein